MSEAGENDDADYRSLAAGYLSRARALLRELETRKRKLRFRASILSVLPPVVLKPIADALPNMDESQKVWLYVGSLVVGIAAGASSIASQLADSQEAVGPLGSDRPLEAGLRRGERRQRRAGARALPARTPERSELRRRPEFARSPRVRRRQPEATVQKMTKK